MRIRVIRKGFLLVGAAAALLATLAATGWAWVAGSLHDFSGSSYAGGEICVVCHVPHGADTSVAGAPLWHHAVTTDGFTVYASATLTATPGPPSGVSKLCLSCHDGTVAIDSFGGATGTASVSTPRNLGRSMADDHPVSITYDAALATADPGLFNPTSKTVTIGGGGFTKTGKISSVMLVGGKLECSSCHSVHNDFVQDDDDPLLKITKAGSALCLACHNK